MHRIVRSWDSEQSRLVEDEDGIRMLVVDQLYVPTHVYAQAIDDGAQALVCFTHDTSFIEVERFGELREERRTGSAPAYWVGPQRWSYYAGTEREPGYVELSANQVVVERAPEEGAPEGFVNLHTHTEFSPLDGLATLEEIAAVVVADGQPALGITDHGTVASHPDLQKLADRHGFTPIFGCLMAGQMLMTRKGPVPIEKIQAGDQVLTHRGRFRPVARTMSHEYRGALYTLRAGHLGATTITLTDEHPVLVADSRGEKRWARADELRGGRRTPGAVGIKHWAEYVCMPRLAPGTPQSISVDQCLAEAELYRHEGEIRTARSDTEQHRWAFPTTVAVDDDFAYFLGLLAAEGNFSSIDRGMVFLTFNLGEYGTLAAWAVEYLTRWGIHASRYIRQENSTVTVYFCHRPMAAVISPLLGVVQPERTVPPIIFDTPREVRQSFLRGLIDGDGKHSADGNRSLKLSSESMVWGARQLLADDGYYSKVVSGEDGPYNHWIISYKPSRKWSRTWSDDDYVYVPLHEVIEEPGQALTVYNCEVEEDNSYVSDFTLHNCEAYFVPDRFSRSNYGEYMHLCLYALNDTGLRNLWAMSTESYRDGLYGKYPRLDWDTLERLNEGVACSTGCLRGPVLRPLLGDADQGVDPDPDRALANLGRLRDIFTDRLYVELHTNQLAPQIEGNRWLAKVAAEQGLPAIAVADAHYACPEDKHTHDVWVSVQLHKEVGDDSSMFADHPDLHVHTADQARAALAYLGDDVAREAVAETVRFSRRCTARIEAKPSTPIFSKATEAWPDRIAHDVDRLLAMCEKNWEWRLAGKPHSESEYLARFDKEFKLLVDQKFCGYFLMVADQVNYAKSNGILVGPGRGSGGGSLIAYLMGITEIDPVEHDLLFERFLTQGRKGLPDFDIDYPSRKKQFMLDYVAERWGSDRVVTVGSHLRLKSKGAIRDTAQAMRGTLPEDYFRDINAVSDIIKEAESASAGLGIPWDELWVVHEDQLEPYRAKYPALFEMATKLYGRLRSYGKHAAGVIIDPDNSLEGALPLRCGDDGDPLVTQFDYRVLEELGYVKFDFLNITTLDALQAAAELILRDTGRWIDFRTWRQEYDDPEVFEAISEGWTSGIFQIETHSGTRMCREFKPTSLAELADVITLVRPGPKNAGLTEKYLKRRSGQHKVSYDDPRLEAVLAETYGLMIYQEDIMAVCSVIAGYSLEEADEVRKILGKKQVEKVSVEGQRFVSRAVANGTDPEVAKALWVQIKEFAKYSFNRSHAFAYAVIAVWSAWTKTHFPVQMLCGLLTHFDQKRIPEFVEEARRLGVAVLPPDINASKRGFVSDLTSVRYGVDSVHGIGPVAAEAVIATQPYESYADFLARRSTKCDRGDITKLIKVGAFDSLGEHRRYLEKLAEAQNAPSTTRCVWLTPGSPTTWPHPDGPVTLPCGFDWDHEPVRYGRPTKKALECDPNAVGKPLKAEPPPKRCTRSCRRFSPAPDPTPEQIEPYTAGDIAAIEVEMLGLRLSTSEFDLIPPDVLAELATARDVATGPPGDYAVAAYVSYRPKSGGDRHGRPMGWLSLSTRQGSINAVVFTSKVEALGPKLTHKGLAFAAIHKPADGQGPQLIDLEPAN